jgi:hypothetical protein
MQLHCFTRLENGEAACKRWSRKQAKELPIVPTRFLSSWKASHTNGAAKIRTGLIVPGFVAYVFEQLFPERAASFRTDVDGFINSQDFQRVETPQPGDLIVFPEQETGPYKGVNHIGIVQNEHGWVGSQSSTGVSFVLFSKQGYWSKRPKYFYRYKYSSAQAISSYLESMGR